MIDQFDELKNNLHQVKEKIKTAAALSGRSFKDITLLAVSKNQPLEKIDFFRKQGIEDFGENKVQELIDKYNKRPEISWHFIGHLQRNKVKYLVKMENCRLIHSLDSWRLAEEINKRAEQNQRKMQLLLEVNIAGDENKYGVDPDEVYDFVREADSLQNIEIRGLMTIVPYVYDPEEVRPYFKKMAALKKEMRDRGFENIVELSMGMSNDYQVAIEEGATIVRIGSSLFERRGG
ncbi:MAG: YggS family pyridoxal phosphate-dependent enzyme [Halanaerobiaceae bacterium]|nr:YggS family pyridoxal phosphate-dependent enzyme [Halanaerobiaceae bacterium]